MGIEEAMMQASSSKTLLVPPVTTLLTPDERLRLDAAGLGVYRALHRVSVMELMRDLRERSAAAMVVSATASLQLDPARLASVVREFPRVPSVVLISQLDSQAAQAVLTLGRCGIRTLIDVRDPRGWQELRNVLISDRAADIHRTALAQLSLDLGDAPAGSLEFFRIMFRDAESPRTVREVAARLQVVPSTLMSRFYRASLPAPKHYLSGARLIRAARLLENSGLSVSSVADYLDYSSPQSFSRHLRTYMRLTAREFRSRYDGEGMLQHFRDEFVLPYLKIWRAFDPLDFR